MPEICIIQPAGEPIHVEEAKLDRRVSDSADDTRLRSLVGAARRAAEMITRQQFLHARWQLTLDRFPMAGCGTLRPFRNAVNIPAFAIVLPHSPLVRVVSVQYVDMAGATQTMPSTDYVVNKSNAPGLITPAFGKIWPITLPQIAAVTVTYDAGYASPMKVSLTAPTQIAVTGPVTFNVGDRVEFYSSGDMNIKLPTPLDLDSSYLVASVVGPGIYTISDAAGNAITFTDVGVGIGRSFIGVVPDGIRSWMLLRVGTLYENREEIAILTKGKAEQLPYVNALLDPYITSLP
jgi:uncharacterized phiE125 gp8 family phage protein